ncbi:MAG: helix-turn-helix transcriptional regulator [Alphaproteobacteria bacterium]|nr:helix-turn-helix transcriptional regulator [Alphaproteobacteria bacterium]
MAHVQYLDTPAGRLAVVPEDEFRTLVEAAEDNADAAAIAAFRKRLAAGEEELVPDVIVGRLLEGENPIRVWREHRGMKASDLAEKAELSQAFISQIETGKREPSISAIKAIAAALHLAVDDLLP